ncbi:MAG TPA: hypothetical protein VMA83_01600 [Solirubrobacteraceae bacterium]|nr:hypothetical protein [Solirubrobacteraceae bacterium]
MSGAAVAAQHYLIRSTNQISPSVLKKLRGRTGAAGKQGATGREGPAGPPGPGAVLFSVDLPASTSPTFTKVGSYDGIALEAECAQNETTHAARLIMTYTSPNPMSFSQSYVTIHNGETAKEEVGNESFTDGAASEPAFWEELEAEDDQTSSTQYSGENSSQNIIYSESYVVTGGPSGKCEGQLGWTPAS